MSVLTIIWSIIKSIPAFLSIVREILKFLKEVQDKQAQKEMKEKIKEATVNAKEQKNTAKLDQLFGNRGNSDSGNNSNVNASDNKLPDNKPT